MPAASTKAATIKAASPAQCRVIAECAALSLASVRAAYKGASSPRVRGQVAYVARLLDFPAPPPARKA